MFLILACGFLCALISNNNETTALINFVATIICVAFGLGLILAAYNYKKYGLSELDYLAGHIDTDKTRVYKENDEATDLYITVDGKEYHFELTEQE